MALSECLTTDVTAVRSLICVYAVMSRQVTGQSERLATDVTAVRPLSCMSDKMTPQMTAIVRGVLAPLARVLAVPANVAVSLLHVFV